MCDVLDNWEEIDEAGLTNTLQKIQAERKTQEQFNSSSASAPVSANANENLYSSPYSSSSGCGNFQPMKLLQRKTQDSNSSTSASAGGALKSPLDDMAATFQPVMMVLHKTDDEYQSANYTPPISSSTVKILRRPTQSSEPRNNGMRPRQPIKTLQQREQEYAEARLRILGSAKNPEDDAATSNANAPTSPPATNASTPTPSKVNSMSKVQGGGSNAYNHHYQQQQQHFYYQQQSPAYNNRTLPSPHQQQQPPQQTWSPVVGGSVSSQLQLQQQQHDSILRMPRGPDGSIGFQTRR